ncbi:putative paratose transferase [Leadbettera azotonutricia ZAS-9]|uniref:Putative paratose transferase n=2 Tax=Leadbettera azotonutricia TaxID=150829 RepID=F5YAK6_LEAAZ|nr:putative paratose transferase [Leadbettera azotonutricia ZAS-9]
MELIDFSKNKDSISKQMDIESILLYGNPDNILDAEITICIPTYKRPNLLRDAIESAVNQNTNIGYQIIVVDNDSDFNNTEVAEIVQSFNDSKIIYYKNKENLQLFGNLNRCAVLARTKYFAFLHDDDLLLEDYLEHVATIITKVKKKIKCLLISCTDNIYLSSLDKESKNIKFYIKKVYARVKSIKKLVKIPFSANIFYELGTPTCGILFERNAFIESGGFNADYFPSADGAFFLYFSRNYNTYKYKKILSIYRFMVNESERPETKEKIRLLREFFIQSIKEINVLYRVIISIFQADINSVIMKRFYNRDCRKSLLYKITFRVYDIYLGTINKM